MVNTDINLRFFSPDYLNKAINVFLNPKPKYSWKEIIKGAEVHSQYGKTRRMSAVEQNTWRGFYKIDKKGPGAKEGFTKYFLEKRNTLIEDLSAIQNREELHSLCNRICDEIRVVLTNCNQNQLVSFGKIRKPVDLYIEHLTAMAIELDKVRIKLIPFLFLPLDCQIIKNTNLFTEQELKIHGLSRKSTYKDIISEKMYFSLQLLLNQKTEAIADILNKPFNVIYFDLLWNDRFNKWGGNLFETNCD